MKRSLLIGCGNSRVKQVYMSDQPEWVGELTTIDVDPNCGADIVIDMDRQFIRTDTETKFVLPFENDTFDESGCYNAMEHWGRQGDWRGWFAEMAEYHRILKPMGTMGIVVPIGADAFADPGHTRFFQENYFGFLSQLFYEQNQVQNTCFTDYRWHWKLNFDILFLEKTENHHLNVMLRKN